MDGVPRRWDGVDDAGWNRLMNIRHLLFALAALATAPAHAEPTAKADPALVGHYYISGIRETGSELLLRADGGFDWFMSYGAVDQFASGRWRREGTTIILESEKPDPASLQPVENRRAEWSESAETYLREDINARRTAEAQRRCPFLEDVGYAATASTVRIDEETEKLPLLPKAEVDAALIAANRAMAESAAKPDDAQLVDAARAARLQWEDKSWAYLHRLRENGMEQEVLPKPVVPKSCGYDLMLTEDTADPAKWLRGIAVVVQDPNEGQSFGGFAVSATYSDGHVESAKARVADGAFLPRRPGASVVEIGLTAKWLPDGAKTLSVAPLAEGVLFLAINSRALRGPAFDRMRLEISDDGLRNAEWGKGLYQRQ
jgi:hypothetical protein